MKILISGSGGKIGQQLCRKLMESEHEVYGITSKSITDLPLCKSIHFDWLRPTMIDLPKIDLFIHMAGITSPYYLRENLIEGIQSNILSFVYLLESLKKANATPRLLMLGTATEYGSTLNYINENSKTEFETFYEILKKSSFDISKQYRIENFLSEVIYLRLSNIYGFINLDKSDDRSFIDKAILSIFNNENVSIFGTGEYLRDYLHIEDLTNLLIKIIEKPAPNKVEIYNVGSYDSITLINAIKTIIMETKKIKQNDSKIEFVTKQENLYELEWRNHSIQKSKIIQDYSWIPSIKLHEGVRKSLLSLEKLQNA